MMPIESEFIEIITTTPNEEVGLKIADALVEHRLAACVQVGGSVVSVYRWKEKVEHDQEHQCMIKTRRDMFDQVVDVIREVHPYETPQIIATPIVGISDDYTKWMRENLK
jgi:periplasmic divalent cation tolerance protein